VVEVAGNDDCLLQHAVDAGIPCLGIEPSVNVGAVARKRGVPIGPRTEAVRHELLRFLLDRRAEGKQVVGYRASGKGNTLLNYCGISSDLLEYTVDRNPYKHGRLTPGTRIPIHDPAQIDKDRPTLRWHCPGTSRPSILHTSQTGAASSSFHSQACIPPLSRISKTAGVNT